MGRWGDGEIGKWKHFSTCLAPYLVPRRAVSAVRPSLGFPRYCGQNLPPPNRRPAELKQLP
ncbi:hypothetical protein D5R40_03160 [Okeania hirsuta]|uniref:Uncharacterized protein n=1 Tax=Okeania hirsuta TaxID=1458930 RepID=A0A3N6RYA8_9CYAN|nr:hypothetical protein D4Z78_01660 [Okeania hirsuta]RQH54532.1 hypothetical protein D5R40_03160 [Okeania hirsuta]